MTGRPGAGAPFDGRRFRNEGASADRTLLQVFRMLTSGERKAWPRWIDNRHPLALPAVVEPGTLAVTFVNHSTFLLQSSTHAVLTDPVYARRVSPLASLGPARVRDPGVPFDALPHIDLVLVSHNHYDHMDLATLRRLQRRFDCAVVTTLGNRAYLERRGLRQVSELDWWQTREVSGGGGAGLRVTATPAQHFSARTPFDRNRTLWAGFALDLGGVRLYFAGDSGYCRHFAEIGARLGPFDVALLPIGAYEPRWFMSAAHMNPEEAVRAHLDLRSPLTVGMHFGCFQLTDEAIDEPPLALAQALAAAGVDPRTFRVPEHGETIMVGKDRIGAAVCPTRAPDATS